MNMVKLIFDTSHRLFRVRLVLGLIATAFIVIAAVTPAAAKMDDLIVLSDDYFAVADNAIKDIRSVLTIVAGRIVYADTEYTGLDQQ